MPQKATPRTRHDPDPIKHLKSSNRTRPEVQHNMSFWPSDPRPPPEKIAQTQENIRELRKVRNASLRLLDAITSKAKDTLQMKRITSLLQESDIEDYKARASKIRWKRHGYGKYR